MPLKPDQVAAAIQSGVNAKISDGRSLYLVVRNGRGFWVHEYRDGTARRSRGLGSAADVSPAAARRARDDFASARRAQGRRAMMATTTAAPAATIEAPRQAHTVAAETLFGEAHAFYLTNHAAECSERQGVAIERLFKNHTGPLDGLPVGAITVNQVADVLRPLWRGPAAGSGARLRQLMEHVLRAAGVKGEANPALWDNLRDLLSKKTVKAKAHPSMAYADLPTLMTELVAPRVERERKPGRGQGPNKTANDFHTVARCLRFCILTATRSNEAIGADWTEVNLTKREWTIPAVRMKMDEDHTVPLSDEAIALLGKPHKSGRIFVVSSTYSGAINKDGLLKLLREFRSVETVHGFRSTFATWAEDARYMPDVIEASLAHEKGDATTRAYRRSKLLPARRELMDAWAKFACGTLVISNAG